METESKLATLCTSYAREIAETLAPADLARVIAGAQPGDVCDESGPMLRAFCTAYGRQPTAASESDAAAINAAGYALRGNLRQDAGCRFAMFRASGREITGAALQDFTGPIDDVVSGRLYGDSYWISRLESGAFWVPLENSDHASDTLAPLEILLYRWARLDDDSPVTGPEADSVARAAMATRPDLAPMSLDEWMAQNHDKLTAAERAACLAALDLHESAETA